MHGILTIVTSFISSMFYSIYGVVLDVVDVSTSIPEVVDVSTIPGSIPSNITESTQDISTLGKIIRALTGHEF